MLGVAELTFRTEDPERAASMGLRSKSKMSLARAIEYHVNVFVEHSMSSSPSTLATLKISRRNLAEAAAMAIGAKSIRQSPAVTDSKTALVGRLMQRAQGISRAEAMRATGWSR